MSKTSENLRILADYIESEVPQKALNMANFRSDGSGEEIRFFGLHDCGTVGCALGWAPFCLGLPPRKSEDHWSMDGALFWWDYSLWAFPDLERGGLWEDVFDCDLSSDKKEVVWRLRCMAEDLENEY